MTDTHEGPYSLHKLFWGITLVALGMLFLLTNMGLLDLGDYWRYWPLLLVAGGIAKMTQPRTGKERRGSGLWQVAIGIWLLLSTLELFGLNFSNSWPLLLVFVGIGVVWESGFAKSTNKEESHGIKS